MNHTDLQSHHIRHDKIHQFQLPSICGTAKTQRVWQNQSILNSKAWCRRWVN